MERLEFSQELARDILAKARERGASQGDLVMAESEEFFVTVRLGEIEKISQAREKRLGLRLFFDGSSATASTSDISRDSIGRLLDVTCAMARSTAKDPCSGLPAPEELAKEIPDLDLFDPSGGSLSVEEKTALALEAEKAALQSDPRIVNSEGAEFSHHESRIFYANSHGFAGDYPTSAFNISVTPVAALNGSMQRDYWYSAARCFSRLESPAAVGQTAARRTLRRLGGRKIPTREVPVVFDPLAAASLLGNLSAAISGYSLYKGASFLVDRLGTRVASELVTVLDNGTLPGALGSKPFDGEGIPTRNKLILEQGVLKHYLLDTYSGRKLGLPSTGNAARSIGGPPGVSSTNFYLLPGSSTPEEIIASIDEGFYITELIGFGINLVTGDYSRGAAGLWIQGGELTYPVEEVTIAGNLKDIFMNIESVGNDLEMRDRTAAPTLKITRMTVAGS